LKSRILRMSVFQLVTFGFLGGFVWELTVGQVLQRHLSLFLRSQYEPQRSDLAAPLMPLLTRVTLVG